MINLLFSGQGVLGTMRTILVAASMGAPLDFGEAI